jgi:tetratricopeptide (TPR) repeat protein
VEDPTKHILYILSIGLKPVHIETIERIFKSLNHSSYELLQLSPLDTDAVLVEGVEKSALIFVYWEGIHGPSLLALRRLRAKTSAGGGRIHMIYDTNQPSKEQPKKSEPFPKPPLTILDQRQSRSLGIAGWIKFPDQHIQIERLIFEHTPQSQRDAAVPESLDGAFYPVLPESDLPLIPDISPRGPLHMVAAAFKDPPPPRAQKPGPKGQPTETSGHFKHLVVFHHDSERAREIANLIERDTAHLVTPIHHSKELLACFMRDMDGLAFWFDGLTSDNSLLLRQISQNQELPSLPIALLIPDKDTLPRIKSQLSDVFFDIIAIYQRMRIGLNESLKTLAVSPNQPDTPRGILERLRRPMRPSSPPEYQRTATLQVAETLCQRLALKPGKSLWAHIEMIPYLLRENLLSAAVDKVNLVNQNLPGSYIAHFLAYQVSLASFPAPMDPESTPETKLKSILALPDLSPSQRLQLGNLAFRHEKDGHLLQILNSWRDQPLWREEPEFYMVGGLLLSLKKHPQAASYYAKAVTMDPRRIDFIAAYGEHLASTQEHRYAASLLKTVVMSPVCPWKAKITLIKSLIEDRQLKDAQALLDQLTLEAPGNKDLIALSHGVQKVV